MSASLWDAAEICRATGATPETAWNGYVTGVSIDTRTIQPGDLFVALKDMRDGHEFVTAAFKAGASMALVKRDYERKPEDRVLLRVDDPLKALEKLGIAARERLSGEARVIAVTGSAGKTTTKEMLRACLEAIAPGHVHASEKSYNNHWGVPLTLARMAKDTRFAVFEIGMNHAGEITPLSKMVRPHVAIITTVAPAHLGHFNSVAEIADAKAEIFAGLEPGGVAVLPVDNSEFGVLANAAEALDCLTFGSNPGKRPDFLLKSFVFERSGGKFEGSAVGKDLAYGLGVPGVHNALNSLAVAAALHAIGIELVEALAPLAGFQEPDGRGSRIRFAATDSDWLLINESYNANPASVAAALDTMASLGIAGVSNPRRIAVLGDMLELGEQSPRLHRELVDAIEDAKVDIVLACGPMMKHLFEALPQHIKAESYWAATANELEAPLLETVRGGDVVMIKGSNGMKLSALVEALKKRHSAAVAGVSG